MEATTIEGTGEGGGRVPQLEEPPGRRRARLVGTFLATFGPAALIGGLLGVPTVVAVAFVAVPTIGALLYDAWSAPRDRWPVSAAVIRHAHLAHEWRDRERGTAGRGWDLEVEVRSGPDAGQRLRGRVATPDHVDVRRDDLIAVRIDPGRPGRHDLLPPYGWEWRARWEAAGLPTTGPEVEGWAPTPPRR